MDVSSPCWPDCFFVAFRSIEGTRLWRIDSYSNPFPPSTVLVKFAGAAGREYPAGVEADYLAVFAGGAVLSGCGTALPGTITGQVGGIREANLGLINVHFVRYSTGKENIVKGFYLRFLSRGLMASYPGQAQAQELSFGNEAKEE